MILKAIHYLISLSVVFLFIGCTHSPKPSATETSISSQAPKILITEPANNEGNTSETAQLTHLADSSSHHFKFTLSRPDHKNISVFTGYSEYSDDMFEFNNPAYLKLYRDTVLIFEDHFEGYENIRFQDFESRLFQDSINLFTLQYGLEACDYRNTDRLYYIYNGKAGFISEFHALSNDYVSQSLKYLFPSEPGGVSNHILVIENIKYTNEDQSEKNDTLRFHYNNNTFKKITKAKTNLPTDSLYNQQNSSN